jgi:hypothetical protein
VISLPIASVVSGMQSLRFLRGNLKLARELQPMSPAEKKTILERTRAVAMTGEHERFKTTNVYDGPVGRKLYGVK